MDNNLYIDYLNSLHNYNAQNENAYGERNIDNPYFKDVMVRVGLCDYIKENLTVKKPHILILTGHAGDGKTSIMYQVLTDMGAEFDVKEKLSEITLPNGAKCLCVKDFSEIPKEEQTNHIDRINVMKKSVDMVKNGNYVFMVANTGPLINTFGELFDTNDNKEKSRIQLINMMDNNDGEIKFIQDVPLCVINVATVDNVYFATEFLEKIIQDNLWEKCEACNKHHYCHIYRNRNLIVENKTKVYEFINNHFIWLTEYGTRLTIRSMTEQLTYMITGGMSCEEVTNNDAYKYLFSNLFFGYIGTKLNARALNIIAIAAANKCMYDHKRLRSDEKLLVGKEYKDMFGNAIKEIITDAEKNNAFIGGWTEFLRRTYLFTNIITDDVVISQDYEDVFSKQFKRYLVLRDGIDTPSKTDANLIADALSMIYIGTPSDGTEIPLTLSRESGITQGPLSTLIFGHRFKSDQTLYEYLTEFLLVFVSAKNADLNEGKMHFHDITIEKSLSYWVEPRMALRRFIFYDKAKKKGSIPADTEAYREMINLISDKIDIGDKELAKEYVEDIQDLFHGYAAVVRNRFWGAQTLLPICPEFVLCGVDPTEKKRKKDVNWEEDPQSLDTKFDFTKHNFLSRGGELYYLHLLQGLDGDKNRQNKLEHLLNDLVNGQCQKISKLCM